MFYTFRQNNSGGYYSGPQFVCVEAETLQEANDLFESCGYSFGMVDSCTCCGARWSEAWDDDSLTETPEQPYGQGPLSESKGTWALHYKSGTSVSGGKSR